MHAMIRVGSRGLGIVLGAALVAGTTNEPQARAEETVYVVNVGSNDVSIIDPAAQAVVATVPVGTQPNGVTVSPDGQTVYVSNLQDDTVSLIDAAAQAVVGTVAVGDEPVGIAAAPDGRRVYVANRRSNSVSIIDTTTNRVVATIADGVGPGSNGIALTPDGAFAYVNNASSRDPGTVSVVDTAAGQVVASVDVARNPKRVAIAPDGQTAYVANFRSWNISVVDVPTNSFTAGLRVSGRTVGVAVHPNGQYAYITNLDGTVEILETANNLLTVPIAVGAQPYAIALSRQGGTAYVANLGDDTVSLIDLADDVVTGSIGVGDRPFAIAYGCSGDGCGRPPFTPKPTRTATPSPTITTTPTITLTPTVTLTVPATATFTPDPNAVELRMLPVSGLAGATVDLTVTLEARGAPIAGVQLDLAFAPPVAIAAAANGRPDCAINPETGKMLNGAFQPSGCTHDECRAARFLILSFSNTDPIPNPGTLFTCRLQIAADAAPGPYSLSVTGADASTPDGVAYAAVGRGADVTVLPSGALRAAELSGATGRCATGAFSGEACERDADCDGGLCATAGSVCDGGADDGLLCECPGGACEAGAGCDGDAARGTCRGGRADGMCCDRDFSCAGNRPCQSTVSICLGGVAKGLPCLRDEHCPGSACALPGRRCEGGQFARFSCVDEFDCPGGVCAGASTPLPTQTPGPEERTAKRTAAIAVDGADHSGGGGGCAITSDGAASVRPLVPLVLWLALIAAPRLRRRRDSRVQRLRRSHQP